MFIQHNHHFFLFYFAFCGCCCCGCNMQSLLAFYLFCHFVKNVCWLRSIEKQRTYTLRFEREPDQSFPHNILLQIIFYSVLFFFCFVLSKINYWSLFFLSAGCEYVTHNYFKISTLSAKVCADSGNFILAKEISFFYFIFFSDHNSQSSVSAVFFTIILYLWHTMQLSCFRFIVLFSRKTKLLQIILCNIRMWKK